MQNVGLQTVLAMSHAAERVQSTVQSHTTLAAEQFKDGQEKLNELKKEEIQQAQQAEEVKIREEDQREKGREKRESLEKKREEVEEAPERAPSEELQVGPSLQGQILNIKV